MDKWIGLRKPLQGILLETSSQTNVRNKDVVEHRVFKLRIRVHKKVCTQLANIGCNRDAELYFETVAEGLGPDARLEIDDVVVHHKTGIADGVNAVQNTAFVAIVAQA